MLFNSLAFVFFYMVFLCFYYVIPRRWAWLWLLGASLFFYAAFDFRLLFLMLFIVLVNYISASLILRFPSRKKWALAGAAVINFGVLFIFKYTNFVTSSLGAVLSFPETHIILPMGISFYTFQAMGYTIDVYRNAAMRERNFLKFTLFITFFPQLVAGPIERASALLPQLCERRRFTFENFAEGSQFILLGLFKKIVIADRVAAAVNTVYNNPTHYAGLPLVLATVLFAFQIYCDFSGYSDIAVGCAKIIGIDLTQNFRQPYLSAGIRNFWRRWHISLSGWFKDYVYFPLGGSRVTKPRHYFNLLVTFLVSGLWHGANWTFLLWGALHGGAQVLEDAAGLIAKKTDSNKTIKNSSCKKNRGKKIVTMLGVLLTFTWVCFAWIFFRANHGGDALYISGHLLDGADQWLSLPYIYDVVNNLGVQLIELCISGGAILFLIALEIYSGRRVAQEALAGRPRWVRRGVYAVLALAVLSAGVFGNAGAFIYFQF